MLEKKTGEEEEKQNKMSVQLEQMRRSSNHFQVKITLHNGRKKEKRDNKLNKQNFLTHTITL